MKLELMLKVSMPMGELAGGPSAAAGARDTSGPLDHWPGEFEIKPKNWYAPQDMWDRQPTDEDNWDIPESEVNRLAMLFPDAIDIVKH